MENFMKKIRQPKTSLLILLLITSIFISTACSLQKKPTELATGKYVMETTEDEQWSWVLLKENSEFEFSLGWSLSYLPTGTYKVTDDELLLTVEPRENYLFEISGDRLIFINKINECGKVFDGVTEPGSIFILAKDQ